MEDLFFHINLEFSALIMKHWERQKSWFNQNTPICTTKMDCWAQGPYTQTSQFLMNTTCIRAINHSKESHTLGVLCCCRLFSAKTNLIKVILAVRFTFQFRNRLVKTLIDFQVCRLEGKTEAKQFTCKISNVDHLLKGNWCCKKK